MVENYNNEASQNTQQEDWFEDYDMADYGDEVALELDHQPSTEKLTRSASYTFIGED